MQIDQTYKDIEFETDPKKKKKKLMMIDEGVPGSDDDYDSEQMGRSLSSTSSEEYIEKTKGYKSLCKTATSDYTQNLNFFDK